MAMGRETGYRFSVRKPVATSCVFRAKTCDLRVISIIMEHADNIYASERVLEPFAFNREVVQVFPDMIDRSIPGYSLTLPLIGLMAARYVQAGSNVYDLGCSLGAATLAMRHGIAKAHGDFSCQLVGIDNSMAMIERCRALIAADDAPIPVEIVEGDLETAVIENASIVVLNFTLQFVPPERRDGVMSRIYEGLRPGGILILSEKVVFAEPEKHERFIDIHHDFKRYNGYSDLEVAQKRNALENVMIPETIERNRERILGAGFGTCELWFQAVNFMSLLAIK